jgi:hypothetical protein
MRTARAAALALACALALAGCSDDGEPEGEEPTWTPMSTPEEPSTSPAGSVPTVAPENETARQFLRRWVSLINLIQRTGDATPYRAIAGPDCRSCRQFADRVESIYSSGGYIKTGGSRIVEMTRDGEGQWTVSLMAAPTELKESANAKVQMLEGGPYGYVVYLLRVDGRWSISAYLGNGQ